MHVELRKSNSTGGLSIVLTACISVYSVMHLGACGGDSSQGTQVQQQRLAQACEDLGDCTVRAGSVAANATVEFTTIATGQAIATPANLPIAGEVKDRVAGHSYEVEVTLPGGATPIAAVNANGQWGLGLAAIATFPNDAMLTFSAELRDTTGPTPQVRDRAIVNVLDMTPFDASISTRKAPVPDSFMVRVATTGIEAMNPAIPAVGESLGRSLQDALAQAFEDPEQLTGPQGCWFGLDLGAQQWDEIAAAVAAGVGAAFGIDPQAVLAVNDLANRTQICSSGVTPELTAVALGSISADLEPIDGGLAGPISTSSLDADISLQTSIQFRIDLSGVDEIDGVPIPEQIEIDEEGIHLCAASYTAGGASYDATLTVATGTPDVRIDIADASAATMTFDNPVYDADGACGWGIFSGLVADSQATVEDAITTAFDHALSGEGSLIADIVDHAWSDSETAFLSPIRYAARFDRAEARAPTATPDQGGLTFVARTMADGDGTQASCTDAIYAQTPVMRVPADQTPQGAAFDFATGLSTIALNQVLSGGAESRHMTFNGQQSWNDWGLCPWAPVSASCDDPAILDGSVLQHLHPALAAATGPLVVRYDAELAPFVAMELDPGADQQPEAFFFLGSYTASLVDPATATVWLEYTCGVEDQFDVSLGEIDGAYAFALPADATCVLTSTALPHWPNEAQLQGGLHGPMLDTMLDQAVAALYDMQSPEVLAATAPGGISAMPVVGQRRADAVFYSYTLLQ